MNAIKRRSRHAAALSWGFSLAALVAACGGGDDGTAGATPAPAPAPAPAPGPAPGPAPTPAPIALTPAGDPEGLPTFATIGAAGGTLASSDGRLTVTVPAGAFAADTVVGILPITATAPGAFGSGYRLTPEGMTFAAPVTLRFDYPATEAAASLPDTLRVATYDSRGHWQVLDAVRDTTQRTLAVTTTHFSDWSYVGGQQIVPASAIVALNKTQQLRVIDCGEGPDPDGGNSQQRLLLQCIDEELPPLARNWSVNAIAGGNSTVGTIAGGSSATYNAPSAAPHQNPVAASAQVNTPAAPTTLVSNIEVVDELRVYTGTIFGGVVTRISNKEQFVEMSANLRFTFNPDLSVGGDKWYDGSGTAFVRGRPFDCSSEGSGSAAVTGAALTLHTEGPLAGTYTLSAGALATVTLTCGDPPKQMAVQLPASASAGGSDICPSLPIGDDPGRLVGSWSCNVSEGSTARANWTLRAIE